MAYIPPHLRNIPVKPTLERMTTFSVPHPSELSKKRGDYSLPKELLFYSVNSSREFLIKNDSELKEYSMPELDSDLNSGFDEFRKKTCISNLDGLLKSLMVLKPLKYPQIWRGIITKFMVAPYCMDSWEILVQKKHKTLFMSEEKFPEYGSDLKSQKFSFYGYKFEALCTNSETVDTNIEFCSVFEAKFGHLSLILGGEVDCKLDNEYVELKTNRILDSTRLERNFSRKMLKVWAQSYLIGISKIIFGFRDDFGILKHVQEYNTHEIAQKYSADKSWNRHVCLYFAQSLLEWILENVLDDSVYKLTRNGREITLSNSDSTKSSIFPEWYALI